MAAIVEYDIRNTKLVDQALQELLVCLIADPHEGAWRLVRLASFPDVYADYLGQSSKKSLPHLQRSTSPDSDSEEGQRFLCVPGQVASEDRQVVSPLTAGSPTVR